MGTVSAAPPWIGADTVRERFDLDTAIASQRDAFIALGTERATLGPRVLLDAPEGGTIFSYVARLDDSAPVVTKFGSVVPTNVDRGLPVVHSIVTVLDAVTGVPAAILDGDAITELRTAAATAVAVQQLAPPTVLVVAVLGAGVQGAAHVRAMHHVHPAATILLWDRRPEHAASVAAALSAELGASVLSRERVEDAVEPAAVIIACTASRTPVVPAGALGEGCLVVSIGSFSRDRDELGADVLTRAALVVVDDVETAIEQAGSVVNAVTAGVLDPGALEGLGEILAGRHPGRIRATDIVVYNSAGLGIQDAAAAIAILGSSAHPVGTFSPSSPP